MLAPGTILGKTQEGVNFFSSFSGVWCLTFIRGGGGLGPSELGVESDLGIVVFQGDSRHFACQGSSSALRDTPSGPPGNFSLRFF